MIPTALPVTGERENAIAHLEQFVRIIRDNPDQDFTLMLANEFGQMDGVASANTRTLYFMTGAILANLRDYAELNGESALVAAVMLCMDILGLGLDPEESVNIMVKAK